MQDPERSAPCVRSRAKGSRGLHSQGFCSACRPLRTFSKSEPTRLTRCGPAGKVTGTSWEWLLCRSADEPSACEPLLQRKSPPPSSRTLRPRPICAGYQDGGQGGSARRVLSRHLARQIRHSRAVRQSRKKTAPQTSRYKAEDIQPPPRGHKEHYSS
jgi:hypothetical protein